MNIWVTLWFCDFVMIVLKRNIIVSIVLLLIKWVICYINFTASVHNG